MKKKNVKIVEFLIMLVVATAAASIACFVWFNQTAAVVLAAVAAVAAVVAAVVALVKTSRNRDEQTRKSTYKVDWKLAAVAAIAAASIVFIVAIPFAPIKTGWVLIPAIPLIAILFAVASNKGKKAVGLALAMLLMMVGTTGLTYAAMHDFEFGGETTIVEGDYIDAEVVEVEELNAEVVKAEELDAENVKTEELNATQAVIQNVKATEVNVTEAKIDKVEATNVNVTNATIENINATKVDIENATIENINATEVVIENATVAPTEPTTKPAPQPTTQPQTTQPQTTQPQTTQPVKNPTLKLSAYTIKQGGRIVVTLKDATASDVYFVYSDRNGSNTSRGLSLRHISGNQYDIVIDYSQFVNGGSVEIGVAGGNAEVFNVIPNYD